MLYQRIPCSQVERLSRIFHFFRSDNTMSVLQTNLPSRVSESGLYALTTFSFLTVVGSPFGARVFSSLCCSGSPWFWRSGPTRWLTGRGMQRVQETLVETHIPHHLSQVF